MAIEKQKVLEALDELGFITDHIENIGYAFEFEGLTLLYQPDDNDEEFFRISVPNIYEIEDAEQRPMILEIINNTNNSIKYTKTVLLDDNVWVSYENRVPSDVDVEELVRFSVFICAATVNRFNTFLTGEADTAGDSNDNTDNN